MISQKVKKFANDNGFDFYVSRLGYSTTAQITNLDGSVNITRCSNNSKLALQAINTLIAQRKLDAKSDDAIVTESEQAITDLLPPTVTICEVEAEQAYQELLPVVDEWELNRQERIAAQGTLTADDFQSTYSPRDNYGDNAFSMSMSYGCGALI
jgi:hypothetical protein